MTESERRGQMPDQRDASATLMPDDYASVLMSVIDEASNDRSQLRKLVYVMAWYSLRPEAVISRPAIDATSQAKTIAELEQAMELKRAIRQVEAFVARRDQETADPPTQSRPDAVTFDEPASRSAFEATDHTGPSSMASLDQTPNDGSPSQGSQHKVLITLPDGRSGGLPQTQIARLDRIPAWLDPAVRISLNPVEAGRRPQAQIGLLPFIQLVAAAVMGVALFVGVSHWISFDPQVRPAASSINAATPNSSNAAPPVPVASTVQQTPQPDPLPFPHPKSYGVYAESNGQLIELEQSSLKIPDKRVPLSAEITKAARAAAPSGNLSFVVFRRDLVNNAPQTVSVRVVAQVARALKFVDGKAVKSPIQGVWRIRSKSYEFRVSPVEGQREMVVIRPDPDFVLPPGRYALVFNGVGYDFNVAGPVTAPEHCLEQVSAVNGTVITECSPT
jgi:hypothetical protein